MKAIILAAGQAMRLRPITEKLPKTLIDIDGKTILDHQIEALTKAGVDSIVFVVGFEKEQIMAHVQKHYPDLNITFVESKDYKTTSAAYSLWCARDHLSGPTLYLNSDALCHPDIIARVVHDPRGTITAVRKTPWNEEQVNMEITPEGKLVEIGKHVPADRSYGEFVGVTKFDDAFCTFLVDTLDQFVQEGNLQAFAADSINGAIRKGGEGHILDVSDLEAIEIDTPEELEVARKLWRT